MSFSLMQLKAVYCSLLSIKLLKGRHIERAFKVGKTRARCNASYGSQHLPLNKLLSATHIVRLSRKIVRLWKRIRTTTVNRDYKDLERPQLACVTIQKDVP